MRILIASAPYADTFGYSMPPPGLLRLGGWLRDANVDVELADLAFCLASGELGSGDDLAEQAAKNLCKRLGPETDCLGLSTMGASLPVALLIGKLVKQAFPKLALIFGGPGVHGVDASLIERFSFVDAVLRGEGEEALSELFTDWKPGTKVDFEGRLGFTWRSPTNKAVREPDRSPMVNLDALSAPAWDLLPPLDAYKAITGEGDGLVPVDSGRGCSFDCSFCTIGRYWKRRSRTLSPARLADEIEALEAFPEARQAYLCHDIFGADRAHALAFCHEMRARQTLPFEVRARLDHLDNELIDAMARAGCYRVLVGIESASDKVRARANKRLSGIVPSELIARIVRLSQANITPILSLILGLPGEGRAELEASLDFLSLASAQTERKGAQISLHLVNPQPGCALGDEFGPISKEVAGIPPDMALGAGLTPPERELIEAHPEIFSTWHLLTNQAGGSKHLSILASIAKKLPALLMRYPKTHLALMHASQSSTLDLFEERQQINYSFEAQARALHHPVVDAMLLLEQAKLRACARAGAWRTGELHWPEQSQPIQLYLEPLEIAFDVNELLALMIAHQPLPTAPSPTHYLVGCQTKGAPVTTHRISSDLFHIYTSLGNALETRTTPLARELVEHLATLEGGALLRMAQPQV